MHVNVDVDWWALGPSLRVRCPFGHLDGNPCSLGCCGTLLGGTEWLCGSTCSRHKGCEFDPGSGQFLAERDNVLSLTLAKLYGL